MSILAYERTLRRIDKHPKQLDPETLVVEYRAVACAATHVNDHTYIACISVPYLGIERVYQELLRFTFVQADVFETLFFSYAICTLEKEKLLRLLITTRTLRPDVYENFLGAFVNLSHVFNEYWDILKPNPLPVPS